MTVNKPWKRYEKFGLGIIYLILLCNLIILKDSPIAVTSAFFGITYTFLAGKGNPICYLFGIMGSGFYGYLSFHNALWGNLLLYMGYYIPMQVIGFFKWNSHLKTGSSEIIKTSLSKKERLILFAITLILTAFAMVVLYFTQDKKPIIDGITTVFSLAGMYLTVRRAIEQWGVWIFVNGLSAIMWGLIALSGEKVYSTVIMWSVYFVLGIYFYFCWKKELK